MSLQVGSKELSDEKRNKILSMLDPSVIHCGIAEYHEQLKSTILKIIRCGWLEIETTRKVRKLVLSLSDTSSLMKIIDAWLFKPAPSLS